MSVLTHILGWLRAWQRDRVVDDREKARTLAVELDKLAELMVEVLKVTNADGRIQKDRLSELDLIQKRVWNRWVSILGTSGYASRDAQLQAEIERCVRIAHAAPGAYVEEIHLAQIAISNGCISSEGRSRFSTAIHSLQDLATRLRLNV